MPFFSRFLAHAHAAPDRPAVVLGNMAWRYRDLSMHASVCSRALASASGTQLCIGMLMNNCYEFFPIFLGTAMAGGIAAVLSPKWPENQLRHVLSVIRPSVLFSAAQYEAVSEMLPEGTTTIIADSSAYATWLRRGEKDLPIVPTIDGDRNFLIGFTSGTSGYPKPFIRNHRSWNMSLGASIEAFGVRASDGVLAPGPLIHGLTLYAAIEALSAGATIHLLESFDEDQVLERLIQYPIRNLVTVPTMLVAIAEAATKRQRSFTSVQRIISSGAKLDPETRRRVSLVFPEADTLEYYGASELGFVSMGSLRAGIPPSSVGRPFPGVEVEIRREDGSSARTGETGRVFVKSPFICEGYLGSQDETGFRKYGAWATVGDLGWFDEDRCLYLAGREQDMIITGGLNVYPAEVEAVLCTIPEIAEAVVVGIPDPVWGEIVTAVVMWRESMKLDFSTLRAGCQAKLPNYKCPRRVLSTDRLPRTASGKSARAAIKDMVLRETSVLTIVE